MTARATELFPHYHRTYKNLEVLSLEICSFRKKCPSLCLCHTDRSLPLDALVISYHHQNTGHKNSNGRIDEMIGPQEQLEEFLIIIGLTKI